MKYVVIAREEHGDEEEVFGPSSRELCDAFVDGCEYINDSSVTVFVRLHDDKITSHLKHVSSLEVAWYGPESDPVSLVVECTKCGEVVANLWEKE